MAADRGSIEAGQLEELRKLLTALLPENRFYARKLGGSGVDGGLSSLQYFFDHAPFTFKKDLLEDQKAYPPYGSDLTFPMDRYTRFSQTSGSAGHPMRWLDTPQSWDWMIGNWRHVFSAPDINPTDRIYFAFSFGPFLGFWTAFEAASRMGCLCIPGGGMRTVVRLRTIIETGATVLCCTPTYAIRLAEVATEENIDLTAAKVRKIVVAGEPGGSIPATRGLIEKLWNGAQVVDHHGMTETGPVSYGCPIHAGVLHVIESSYIAEILDAVTHRPVSPGGSGELVLTNLGRIGSPLLRYRTGDLVKRGVTERCECGSYELALEGGILGRTDDMIVVRGINIYPSAVEDVLRAYSIAEYRVEIHERRALTELKVLIEPSRGHIDPEGLAQSLESKLSDTFALRIAVSSVPAGSLPRFEAKAHRWIRK